jgi:uncharacterized membrane protein
MKFLTYWPVIFRAVLYFLIAALPEIISAIHDCLDGTSTWGPMYGWWTFLKAGLSGLIATRAFYDGAAQRHTDQLNGTNPFKPHTETNNETKTP